MYAFMLSISVTAAVLAAIVALLWTQHRGEVRAAEETSERLRRERSNRKVVERQLRRQRAQLAAAQRLARMGTWDWDVQTQSGAFSDELYRVMGVAPEDFAGGIEKLFDLVVPEDKDRVVEAITSALSSGSSCEFDARVARPDGEVRTLQLFAEVELDAEGRPVRIWGTGQDVTERRRQEEALASSNVQLAAAVKRLQSLDAMKDTFLTAVSHELRTPLTTVLGFAKTLESDGHRLTPAQRREILRRVAHNAERLQFLLADLLDLDRLRRGIVEPRRRPTDVAVLVGRMVDASGLATRRSVHLSTESAVCSADPAMVERIVENLLSNVDRHTPEGSDVWVKVVGLPDGVLIEVADAGAGIPSDVKEEIFEPFTQGDHDMPHSPGVGIGLSLVARFAEAHGGRAEVKDRLGGGSVFQVFLPAGEEPDGFEITPRVPTDAPNKAS